MRKGKRIDGIKMALSTPKGQPSVGREFQSKDTITRKAPSFMLIIWSLNMGMH